MTAITIIYSEKNSDIALSNARKAQVQLAKVAQMSN
jgi:hypothetical protein